MNPSSEHSRFLQGEGLQLMNLMLREKKKSRSGALRYNYPKLKYFIIKKANPSSISKNEKYVHNIR